MSLCGVVTPWRGVSEWVRFICRKQMLKGFPLIIPLVPSMLGDEAGNKLFRFISAFPPSSRPPMRLWACTTRATRLAIRSRSRCPYFAGSWVHHTHLYHKDPDRWFETRRPNHNGWFGQEVRVRPVFCECKHFDHCNVVFNTSRFSSIRPSEALLRWQQRKQEPPEARLERKRKRYEPVSSKTLLLCALKTTEKQWIFSLNVFSIMATISRKCDKSPISDMRRIVIWGYELQAGKC